MSRSHGTIEQAQRHVLTVLATATLLAGCNQAKAPASAGMNSGAQSAQVNAPAIPAEATGEAVFAGGCFWCMETAFEGVPGVASVVSGFSGGPEANPSYEQVSSGTTGHAESVQIRFDPSKISYEKLVDIFWHNIDPLSAGGQFCDRGTQYRSALFYLNDQQKKIAEDSKRAIEESKRFTSPIVTEITKAGPFYPAEEYHQDFYKKSPVRYQSYRLGCGRDRRLKELWGTASAH